MLNAMNDRLILYMICGVFGLAVLSGCGTDPLTEEPDEAPQEIEEIAETVHPTINVDTPAPGTFVTGTEVLVSGSVEEGSAPLERLTIDGEEVPIEGGTFEYLQPVEDGPNIIGLRLETEDSGRAVDAFTVFGPSTKPPETVIDNALQIELGQEFLDNNTTELDDLAGILQALLQDQQFLESFVEEPYELSEQRYIDVNRIDISDARVNLETIYGCLDSEIILGDTGSGDGPGYMEIDLQSTGENAIFEDEIFLSTRSTRLEAQVCTAVTDGGLDLQIYNAEVTFEEFHLATSEYPHFGEEYPTINGIVASAAESALEDWIGESVADLVLEMLEEFVASYEFGTDPVVTASFDLEDILINGQGVRLEASGLFSAPVGLNPMPENVGSLRRDTKPLGADFSDAPVAVAMSKNALNQLLFALWYGGGTADYEIATEELDGLPNVFQPLTSLDVDLWLPPSFMPATEPEYIFDLAAGGVAVELVADGDRQFDMGIHVRAGVNLEVDEEGLLVLDLDNRAQRITVQAGVSKAPEGQDAGDLAALLRMMVPSVLGEVNVDFAGFPLPSFDLAGFSDSLSSFEGRAISFEPSNISAGGSENGYLVVEGSLREDGQP